MSHLIPFFKEEELIEQTSLEMKFQDKHLVRYLTFAKHCLRKAITICQKDIAAGIFCIVTESDTYFSIWREQPAEKPKSYVEPTPQFQPPLKKTQMSHLTEKGFSVPTEAVELVQVELVHATSPPVADINHLAAAFEPLKTRGETIASYSQLDVSQYRPAHTIDTTKTRKKTRRSKPQTSNIYLTPRSAFLAFCHQELAQRIGPSADYLINKLLAERPNIHPRQMIEAIVAEIPDPKESLNTQKTLEKSLEHLPLIN